MDGRFFCEKFFAGCRVFLTQLCMEFIFLFSVAYYRKCDRRVNYNNVTATILATIYSIRELKHFPKTNTFV
jgi:hypothetical protein